MPRFAMVGSALGLAAMLALTTPAASEGGLPYCEDIETFYKSNEAGGANGQCLPSMNPGAYYTKPGEKDANFAESDRQWMCWTPDFAKKLWTNEEARNHNPPFEGACLFRGFGNTATPDEVEDCSDHLPHHPAVCSPGPVAYWGACWSSTSEQWKCIPNNDATIPGLAKGDCKAQVVLNLDGTPTKNFYDGACRFKEEEVVKYRCDSVPGYDSRDATTCGGGARPSSACFTLHKEGNWQCFQKDQESTTPCDWTLLDGKKKFYTGACVFKGNDDYKDAKDFRKEAKAIAAEKKRVEREEKEAAEEKKVEKEEKKVEKAQDQDVEKRAEPTKNQVSDLRNLKWRWAGHQIPGTSYALPRAPFEDKWNTPADRQALVKELEKKLQDPGASKKEYETRPVEIADVDYPERRRTFSDYTKLLDWLTLDSNIESREEL